MIEELDAIDLEILRLLQIDESMTNQQIGDVVFRSAATVYARIVRMTKMGVIVGRVIVLDAEKLNLTFKAHIFICIYGYSFEKRAQFKLDALRIKGISEVVYYGGVPQIGLNVITKNMKTFVAIEKKISMMPEIRSIHSCLILDHVKNQNGFSF
ncbi:Lrp/AsnC family transcriptional regulator [Pedobacter sp. AW31-3R]|uniref:Lrp/AsnC family transcriptional regulator n=1 Tax=Pedobacter sp. AW31-3R TaxID=3445781 RepID=UPI003F9EED61